MSEAALRQSLHGTGPMVTAASPERATLEERCHHSQGAPSHYSSYDELTGLATANYLVDPQRVASHQGGGLPSVGLPLWRRRSLAPSAPAYLRLKSARGPDGWYTLRSQQKRRTGRSRRTPSVSSLGRLAGPEPPNSRRSHQRPTIPRLAHYGRTAAGRAPRPDSLHLRRRSARDIRTGHRLTMSKGDSNLPAFLWGTHRPPHSRRALALAGYCNRSPA